MHGSHLSRSKTDYMECKFSEMRSVMNLEVEIGYQITEKYKGI